MTTRRRSPPTQKALALPDWPKADRETWQAAQETTGVLDDGGTVSHLNAPTRKDLTRRYAYFLSFLAHQGTLDLQGPAAATVTEATIVSDNQRDASDEDQVHARIAAVRGEGQGSRRNC